MPQSVFFITSSLFLALILLCTTTNNLVSSQDSEGQIPEQLPRGEGNTFRQMVQEASEQKHDDASIKLDGKAAAHNNKDWIGFEEKVVNAHLGPGFLFGDNDDEDADDIVMSQQGFAAGAFKKKNNNNKQFSTSTASDSKVRQNSFGSDEQEEAARNEFFAQEEEEIKQQKEQKEQRDKLRKKTKKNHPSSFDPDAVESHEDLLERAKDNPELLNNPNNKNFHKASGGFDAKLIAAFQQPQQQMDAKILTFYTPIEVATYKSRIQCNACRSIFTVLDERQRHSTDQPEGYFDDHNSKTTEDLLERIQSATDEEDVCNSIDWEFDQDVNRICKSSSQIYFGLCVEDVKAGCATLRRHLIADKDKPRGSHTRISTYDLCADIKMCKRLH